MGRATGAEDFALRANYAALRLSKPRVRFDCHAEPKRRAFYDNPVALPEEPVEC